MENKVLVDVKHLVKEFPVSGSGKGVVHAVSDVSFQIYEGETLALVGESGCGKSTLGRLLLRLLEPTSGEVDFDGTNVGKLKGKELRNFRKEMQIIFQDPYASLNPRMNVEQIISEPLVTHKICANKMETRHRVVELMQEVGIPVEFIRRYPHQFSGGPTAANRHRRALALRPRLIVCDEPVSALDVSHSVSGPQPAG